MATAVLRPWATDDGRSGNRLYLWCPGCDDVHAVEVTEPARMWEWNGSLDAPTVSPSILVTHYSGRRCHSFVTDGRWVFGADCSHRLAGQTVPVPPLPEGMVG